MLPPPVSKSGSPAASPDASPSLRAAGAPSSSEPSRRAPRGRGTPAGVGAALLAALLLTACASFRIVELPQREADVYPHAETRAGVSVAVDEIQEPERSRRYFGADLPGRGILPVLVVVSNHGEHRVAVRPADLLLLQGRDVLDPLPVEIVKEIPKDRFGIVTDETEERIDELYEHLTLRETILAPGEHYQGVLFFEGVEPPNRFSRYFRLLRPFAHPTMKLHVRLTDLESDDRVRFGPFGLHP